MLSRLPRLSMLRGVGLAVVLLVLAACSDCAHPCTSGVTFYLSDVVGTLANGSKETLHLCVDDRCVDAVVSRTGAATAFVPSSLGGGSHHLTVKGEGTLQGDYNGPITPFTQRPGGSCSTCRLGAAKVGSDGSITVGEAAPTTSTTPVTSLPATSTSGG